MTGASGHREREVSKASSSVFMSRLMRRLAREPLTCFVILAIPLFLLGRQVREAPDAIRVSREDLVNFVKNHANSKSIAEEVNDDDIAARLNTLPKAALAQIVNDYVAEEALFREARTLGLDQKDYAMRRRMVQQYDAVLRGLAAPLETTPSEGNLMRYFSANQEKYQVEATTSFTHVYFSNEARGQRKALADATALRDRLKHENLAPEQAILLGDRFLYHSHYMERSHDLIASHFGTQLADQVVLLPPMPGKWQGPIGSAYGYHLVQILGQQPRHIPSLDQVRAEVTLDMRRDAIEKEVAAAKSKTIGAYRIELDDALRQALKGS